LKKEYFIEMPNNKKKRKEKKSYFSFSYLTSVQLHQYIFLKSIIKYLKLTCCLTNLITKIK